VRRINILTYNSNKMHKSQSLFLSDTGLHVSDVTITHRQEYKTTVTTASGNCYTILLSGAIVEELELVRVYSTVQSKQYGVTVTRCYSYSCFVLLTMGDSNVRNM